MQIELNDLKWVLQRVEEINEQYQLYAQSPMSNFRDIECLRQICQDWLKRPVEIFELRIEENRESLVKGMFVAFDDGRYEIYRRPGLSPKEVRFVTGKELFHVVLDSDHGRSTDLAAHLDESMQSFSLLDHQPSRAVMLEALAEIAAVEFMYPFQRRQLDLVNCDHPDFVDLANRYGLPQIYVEQYLSNPMMSAFASALGPPEDSRQTNPEAELSNTGN